MNDASVFWLIIGLILGVCAATVAAPEYDSYENGYVLGYAEARAGGLSRYPSTDRFGRKTWLEDNLMEMETK